VNRRCKYHFYCNPFLLLHDLFVFSGWNFIIFHAQSVFFENLCMLCVVACPTHKCLRLPPFFFLYTRPQYNSSDSIQSQLIDSIINHLENLLCSGLKSCCYFLWSAAMLHLLLSRPPLTNLCLMFVFVFVIYWR
jgi:hypothetical protein